MECAIPCNMMSIIQKVVYKQNKQLLKIICKEEDVDYDSIKHLILNQSQRQSQTRSR